MAISEFDLDPALVRDLEVLLDTNDLLDWLDRQAERLAELGFTRGQGVRFNAALQKARNIEYISPGSIIGEHACIISGMNGYVIHYNDKIPRDRRRFAIAHEIGHTFFFDSRELGKPISRLQINASNAATIEHLCDFFARALLLPRRHIEDAVGKSGDFTVPPLHFVPALAREYQVAEQAVARRLLYQLFPRRVAILRLRKHAVLVKGQPAVGTWKISWCAVPWDLRKANSVAGIRIPFRTSSREIPNEMVPDRLTRLTEHCKLDGRWWEGLTAQGKEESRTPFKSRSPKVVGDAFIYRTELSEGPSLYEQPAVTEIVYLALPLQA